MAINKQSKEYKKVHEEDIDEDDDECEDDDEEDDDEEDDDEDEDDEDEEDEEEDDEDEDEDDEEDEKEECECKNYINNEDEKYKCVSDNIVYNNNFNKFQDEDDENTNNMIYLIVKPKNNIIQNSINLKKHPIQKKNYKFYNRYSTIEKKFFDILPENDKNEIINTIK